MRAPLTGGGGGDDDDDEGEGGMAMAEPAEAERRGQRQGRRRSRTTRSVRQLARQVFSCFALFGADQEVARMRQTADSLVYRPDDLNALYTWAFDKTRQNLFGQAKKTLLPKLP